MQPLWNGTSERRRVMLNSVANSVTSQRQKRRGLSAVPRSTNAPSLFSNNSNRPGSDSDFQRLIYRFRATKHGSEQPHVTYDSKICVAVRTRPVLLKDRGDLNCLSVSNPEITLHNCKLKLDGTSKYLDNSTFRFDHVFGTADTTEHVYTCTIKPLVPFVLGKGHANVLAYGHTASGKTYTMAGIQRQVADDLFAALELPEYSPSLQVFVSFFEIYGEHCQDLFNARCRVAVRDGGHGDMHLVDLTAIQVLLVTTALL